MAYVDVAELQRVLQKPAPTAAEAAAMERVVDEGAREIDWDLNYTVDTPAPLPGTAEYAILTEVNLARAVELWGMEFRANGLIQSGPDTIPIFSRLDTWERHHLRLNPLRERYPIG